MATREVLLFQSGPVIKVTVTFDDVANTWSAINIVNDEESPSRVSGSFDGIPFSKAVARNGVDSIALSSKVQLSSKSNTEKGRSILSPDVSYAIAVGLG